jgi:limonene 1,2-monooxygenase
MEFGLFMMPLHPPYRSYADSYDRDLDLLVEADRLGFHEAWIGGHMTERWENAPCPDLLIAKASALTQNIKLATGITLLPITQDPDDPARERECLQLLMEEVAPRVADLTGNS